MSLGWYIGDYEAYAVLDDERYVVEIFDSGRVIDVYLVFDKTYEARDEYLITTVDSIQEGVELMDKVFDDD